MISSLRGVVTQVNSSSCEIDVSGIGYHVLVTSHHAANITIGKEIQLATALIFREDSMTLYGFEAPENRELFHTLLGVSGVGPRSALAVLNELSALDIINAVIEEQDSVFKKVPGIGPKTAKLIVVQLAGKMNLSPQMAATSSQHNTSVTHETVIEALIGLGWNEKVAREATQRASQQPNNDAASLLRTTLSYLSGSKS